MPAARKSNQANSKQATLASSPTAQQAEDQSPAIILVDQRTGKEFAFSCPSCKRGHRAPGCAGHQHKSRMMIRRCKPGRPGKCDHDYNPPCRCAFERKMVCQPTAEEWQRHFAGEKVSVRMWETEAEMKAYNAAVAANEANEANAGLPAVQANPVPGTFVPNQLLMAPAMLFDPVQVPMHDNMHDNQGFNLQDQSWNSGLGQPEFDPYASGHGMFPPHFGGFNPGYMPYYNQGQQVIAAPAQYDGLSPVVMPDWEQGRQLFAAPAHDNGFDIGQFPALDQGPEFGSAPAGMPDAALDPGLAKNEGIINDTWLTLINYNPFVPEEPPK